MGRALIEVDRDELARFRADLRALGPQWPKELRSAHKDIADDVASSARGRATSLGGVHAKAASLIKGKGDQRSARVGPVGGKGIGNVAFWGAKRSTGWNAGNQGAPQHPEWVGNSWDVGGPGGPYAINETIRTEQAQIIGRYDDLIDTLARRAGFK